LNGTAVNAVILIITTLFAKVLGFGRELSLAYVYGATGISDAYIVAYSIPTIIFSGLGTAILTSYIPIYTELAHGNDTQKLKKFHNSVISIVILLSIIIIGVFLIFARQIVRLFAVGFSGETLSFR